MHNIPLLDANTVTDDNREAAVQAVFRINFFFNDLMCEIWGHRETDPGTDADMSKWYDVHHNAVQVARDVFGAKVEKQHINEDDNLTWLQVCFRDGSRCWIIADGSAIHLPETAPSHEA